MAIHLLAQHHALLDLGQTEAELAKAQMIYARAMGLIMSRKQDRDWEKRASSRGLQVAWSESDLIDQTT